MSAIVFKMKKLSKEETDKLGVISHKGSMLRSLLLQLQIGESVIIEKGTDWKSKSPPYRIVYYLVKTTALRFDAGVTPDGSGWIIKRIA